MLDLSDLLWRYLNHPPSQAKHPRDDVFLIEGIEFFEEAQRGANILHSTAGLVPDVDAISAYMYARQGLQSEAERASANAAVQKALARYKTVLERLQEGKILQQPGFREEVEEAQAFFNRLSDASLRLASRSAVGSEATLPVLLS